MLLWSEWLAAAQWALVAAVFFLRRPPEVVQAGIASLLPLPLVGFVGLPALFSAVVVAGTGALEAERPRRGWLAGALGVLALTDWASGQTLWLWVQARSWLQLGMDPASLLVDGGVIAARVLGLALLSVWALRSR